MFPPKTYGLVFLVSFTEPMFYYDYCNPERYSPIVPFSVWPIVMLQQAHRYLRFASRIDYPRWMVLYNTPMVTSAGPYPL
jgi:hypothetical protein